MGKTIEFSWEPDDFNALLETSKYDDAVNISLKYMPEKNAKILEAGCGSGRVVKYFYDLGYKNVHGVEINEAAVINIKRRYPELNIIHGNILQMPFEPDYFEVIVSYGVVEHFPEGIDAPLKALYDTLKVDGIAIITVPSFNLSRRLCNFIGVFKNALDPRKSNFVRKLFGKKELRRTDRRDYSYYVYPKQGDFFEYRLTHHEFERACIKEGFEIIESLPISHIDGLFHIFGPPLVSYVDCRFILGLRARQLDRLLRLIPFLHNHMHACVLHKAAP